MREPYETDEEPPFILIERQFPRIARAIETLWGHPQLDTYITNLILADREGREGFPPDVLNALLKLHNQHVQRFGHAPEKEKEQKGWERPRRTTRSINR